ncbi:MAG: hypothetical protein ACXWNQ_09480, partial [Anaerolineales bacterium]
DDEVGFGERLGHLRISHYDRALGDEFIRHREALYVESGGECSALHSASSDQPELNPTAISGILR